MPRALSREDPAPARSGGADHSVLARSQAAAWFALTSLKMIATRRRALATCGMVVTLLVGSGCDRQVDAPTSQPGSDRYLKPDTELVQSKVPRDATLATLLKTNGLRPDRIQPTLDLISRSFDPRKLKANQPFRLIRTVDGALRGFEYEIDDDRYLRVAPPRPSAPDELIAEVINYKKEQTIAALTGSIDKDTTSLFAAMQVEGESDDLSIELATVFSGEIDFNSELQPGDSFRLAFDKITRETGTVAYGAIWAAEFRNDGRTLRAFRYQLPDGKYGYYDENGRSLRRFFLKSPLKFEPRVTSGFSYNRLHPVLNVRRAHLGVDYAAPVGASVNAVSHGVVVTAGMNGDAGRMVAIRHSSGYESMYLHLSSITVRVGQHVSQGELVGRVGSSGLSTGPHLDYRLRKNGAYVNPLTEHRRMPPGDPIPAGLLEAFKTERDRLAALLPSPGSTPTPEAKAPPQKPAGSATPR
jgi:murein DD-endopeptidase MepM/ murein hydrolase activator NlpD